MKHAHPAHSRINRESLLKCLLLLGFSIAFMVAWATGSIRYYLNPRLYPFVLFAGLAFLLMALTLLLRLFSHRHGRFRPLPCLLFLIPILLMLIKPGIAAVPESAQLSGVHVVGLPAPNEIKNDWGSVQLSEGPIRIEDKNYMALYQELWDHPEKYIGRSVECVGYVSKTGENLPKDEFLAERDLMWCCAADLATVGYLCRTDYAATPPEKSWVRITGTLDVTTLGGKQTPVIVHPTITPIQKPASEYIYPFQ